jgi:hypothetical protein
MVPQGSSRIQMVLAFLRTDLASGHDHRYSHPAKLDHVLSLHTSHHRFDQYRCKSELNIVSPIIHSH